MAEDNNTISFVYDRRMPLQNRVNICTPLHYLNDLLQTHLCSDTALGCLPTANSSMNIQGGPN